MKELIIKASEVKVGDYTLNSLAKHPAYRWCRVTRIYKTGDWLNFETPYWTTLKHPEEAIAVNERFHEKEVK